MPKLRGFYADVGPVLVGLFAGIADDRLLECGSLEFLHLRLSTEDFA